MTIKLLDPITLPITGQCLIEASAGTGKTYTLAALYLRLLLGLSSGSGSGADSDKEALQQSQTPLGVEQILVVTFTEAATQELRDRIRQRIREARKAFIAGESKDPLLARLLDHTTDHQDKARLLELAAAEMDQAAIFTIHGFCQRMLKRHAFESGALFNQELTTDDAPLIRQALLDYWRDAFYQASDELAGEMLQQFKTPDNLLPAIRSFLGIPDLVQEPDYSQFDLKAGWQAQKQALLLFKQSWLAAVADLAPLIDASGINKRRYSKRNLPGWLEVVSAYAQGDEPHAPWDKLNYFRASIIEDDCPKGSPPQHPVFVQIDQLFDLRVPVEAVIISQSLGEVKKRLQAEKARHQLLAFDDLLTQLASALRRDGGERLAEAIRKQYPIAMIDEFQDTDPLQYAIFNQIYPAAPSALLMIGDPKQSIYAFRGADIFTYMQARKQVTAHYTLDTNWRSSTAMVTAANALFGYVDSPFIYDQDIPFYAAKASAQADKTPFSSNGQVQPALNFWLADESLSAGDYLKRYSAACAQHIESVLNSGQYHIGERRALPADIAVLVRDRKEAKEIQQALRGRGIASVFLSSRESVFSTVEARELFYILQAIAEPTDERTLRTALATGLFHLNMSELDHLCQSELEWEALVAEFQQYREHWQRLGVLPMLHNLLATRRLSNRILANEEGERRLTDLLHLGELLQQASQDVEGMMGTLRWLAEHLASPNQNSDEQQLHLESDRSRVTIITIHKSKGLEYELVYLPFICRYRDSSSSLYHDDDGRSVLSLEPDEEIKARVEKERLAEDLRLLYVAITRAVHACYLGVCDIRYRNSKKGKTVNSALGYLLMGAEPDLAEAVNRFAAAFPALHVEPLPESIPAHSMGTLDMFASPEEVPAAPVTRTFTGMIQRDWRVTSYSALSRFHTREPVTEINIDLEVLEEQDITEDDRAGVFNIFTFHRGAAAGTFLHTLFEEIDFATVTPEQLNEVLEKHLLLSGFESEWQPVLADFIQQVLQVPLMQADCRLMDIAHQDRLVEMEFVLPFASMNAPQLNQLLRQHDPLAMRAGTLQFDQIQGMLKGYIDLTLRYDGRYYVVDYKSNHLGYTAEDYSQEAMAGAMIEHRYDLQYVLYTLALHRLLKIRLPDYDYEIHIGGVYYLFLRGMHPDNPEQGVFYTKPDFALIDALDHMFMGVSV
ncbi:exodeoxyribonuclease V subunit beta [Neptunomonas antarctica]|uniref:RecBCD enzyme subunit RecB n=1 Tax=Neptunomonas antarctica TaxID=619304 RepID=A0A1N7NPH4_9GAMM|nr:exodeoxyribonuclease V subunit beta [Neptunomonas antarctica]SIT00119.1 DNA helicase/exodeoxyribonuclease V, beta subunit [Neptunomonas antarctica]